MYRYCGPLFDGFYVAIVSDGRVVCSCRDAWNVLTLGKVPNSSLYDIWHGEAAKHIRNMFRENTPPDTCLNCPFIVSTYDKSKLYNTINTPYMVFLETNATCNLRCKRCDRKKILEDRETPHMSLETYKAVIDDLNTLEYFKALILHNYGEPFLHKDIYDMLLYTRANAPFINVYISTNGMLIDTREKQKIVAATVDQIVFSIDGSSEDSYIQYREGGNFQKAFNNMAALADEKRQASSDIDIVWRYLLFKWNDSDEEMQRAIELSEKTGVLLYWHITSNPPGAQSAKYTIDDKINTPKIESRLWLEPPFGVLNLKRNNCNPDKWERIAARGLSDYFARYQTRHQNRLQTISQGASSELSTEKNTQAGGFARKYITMLASFLKR
ncbi:radical SAM protein [Candidatus Magnetominusculus xianensis]|uniref:Radical SAM protein n=2 Tax=Candidatus Magnetominusculus xianensis TaxID=1748249 RepID=A0ABR5SHD3_9BACT|nr:radical SAM protein [Candidatus Magnetominusculus xianensis]